MESTAKMFAIRLILFLSFTLVPAATINAQDQASQNMRAFATRVHISATMATNLQQGDLIDLYWTSNPGLDQWGAQKPSITRFVASDLRLLAFQQPQHWQETEFGFSAIITISIDIDKLGIFLNAPEDGRYTIAASN